jgi:hypothetical protein
MTNEWKGITHRLIPKIAVAGRTYRIEDVNDGEVFYGRVVFEYETCVEVQVESDFRVVSFGNHRFHLV